MPTAKKILPEWNDIGVASLALGGVEVEGNEYSGEPISIAMEDCEGFRVATFLSVADAEALGHHLVKLASAAATAGRFVKPSN